MRRDARGRRKRGHIIYMYTHSLFFFVLYYLKWRRVCVGCVVREIFICAGEGKGVCEVSPREEDTRKVMKAQ